MPLKFHQSTKGPYFSYGDEGTKYYYDPKDTGSRDLAISKAARQGIAIKLNTILIPEENFKTGEVIGDLFPYLSAHEKGVRSARYQLRDLEAQRKSEEYGRRNIVRNALEEEFRGRRRERGYEIPERRESAPSRRVSERHVTPIRLRSASPLKETRDQQHIANVVREDIFAAERERKRHQREYEEEQLREAEREKLEAIANLGHKNIYKQGEDINKPVKLNKKQKKERKKLQDQINELQKQIPKQRGRKSQEILNKMDELDNLRKKYKQSYG
jgi:hypothetical protein